MPERRKFCRRRIEAIKAGLPRTDPENSRRVLGQSVQFGWRGNPHFVSSKSIRCRIERTQAIARCRPQSSLMIDQQSAHFIVRATGCPRMMWIGNPTLCERIKPKQASIESADPELAGVVLRDRTNFGILTDRLNIMLAGFQIDPVDCSFGPGPDHAVAVLVCEDD